MVGHFLNSVPRLANEVDQEHYNTTRLSVGGSHNYVQLGQNDDECHSTLIIFGKYVAVHSY